MRIIFSFERRRLKRENELFFLYYFGGQPVLIGEQYVTDLSLSI